MDKQSAQPQSGTIGNRKAKAYEIIDRPASAARIIGEQYNPPIYAVYPDENNECQIEALTLDSVFSVLCKTNAGVIYCGNGKAEVYIKAENGFERFTASIDNADEALRRLCSLWIEEAQYALEKAKLEDELWVIYYWTEEEAKETAKKRKNVIDKLTQGVGAMIKGIFSDDRNSSENPPQCQSHEKTEGAELDGFYSRIGDIRINK